MWVLPWTVTKKPPSRRPARNRSRPCDGLAVEFFGADAQRGQLDVLARALFHLAKGSPGSRSPSWSCGATATASSPLPTQRGTLSLIDGGSERLSDFVVEWWQAYAAPQLAPRTQQLYAAILDNHVLPRLGALRLRELRPALIDGFAVDLRSSGVGEETIRKSLAILQTCLQRAVLHDRLASNPVAAVRKPSQARSRVIEPLAPERVERVRSHLLAQGRAGDATLVSVLAYAGLRPGEALALTWGDVRDRTLMVSKRASLGTIAEGAKSSRRSVRAVTMPAALRGDLLEWQLLSGRPTPGTLVFPARSGAVWSEYDYRNWRRRIFAPAATSAGVPGIRPYDLRHSCASLLLAQGRSVIDVADQLGHAPTLTLDTYGHVMRELEGRNLGPDEAIAAARRLRTAESG
jgi:integrase